MLSDLFKPQKPAEQAKAPQNGVAVPGPGNEAETEYIHNNDDNTSKHYIDVLNAIEEKVKKGLNDGVTIDIYNNSVTIHNAVEAAKDVLYELMP